MSYSKEFPDFGPLSPAVAALLNSGQLIDISWHNDACPSFIRASDEPALNEEGSADRLPVLWANYADPAKRETDRCGARFLVVGPSFAGGAYLETESESEAIARLMSYPVQ